MLKILVDENIPSRTVEERNYDYLDMMSTTSAEPTNRGYLTTSFGNARVMNPGFS